MADNDVLGKADALLQRHRAARAPQRAEPPVDFPVLTDVITEGQPPAVPPAPAPQLSEAELERIEHDLRLELLGLLGPEFERLVEAKVHERLGPRSTRSWGSPGKCSKPRSARRCAMRWRP